MPNNDETDLIEDSRTPALAFASQTPALAFASCTPALVHARSHTPALAPATGTNPWSLLARVMSMGGGQCERMAVKRLRKYKMRTQSLKLP